MLAGHVSRTPIVRLAIAGSPSRQAVGGLAGVYDLPGQQYVSTPLMIASTGGLTKGQSPSSSPRSAPGGQAQPNAYASTPAGMAPRQDGGQNG